jgi:hypothetical protein
VGAVVLWIGITILAFGSNTVVSGATVNHYVHLLGYCLSFAVAFLVAAILSEARCSTLE